MFFFFFFFLKKKNKGKENICLRARTLRFLISVVFFLLDIDECARDTDDCHSSRASCTKTAGSFSFSCNNPYTGNGRTCNVLSEGNRCCTVREALLC